MALGVRPCGAAGQATRDAHHDQGRVNSISSSAIRSAALYGLATGWHAQPKTNSTAARSTRARPELATTVTPLIFPRASTRTFNPTRPSSPSRRDSSGYVDAGRCGQRMASVSLLPSPASADCDVDSSKSFALGAICFAAPLDAVARISRSFCVRVLSAIKPERGVKSEGVAAGYSAANSTGDVSEVLPALACDFRVTCVALVSPPSPGNGEKGSQISSACNTTLNATIAIKRLTGSPLPCEREMFTPTP